MTTFFMSTWWGDSKNMEEIEFSRWLFGGRPRQGKNVLPDGLNWLCYFAGSSKSHCENSISFIILESPCQVDMKNDVKSSKHFFWVFQYSRNSQWLSILTFFMLGWKVEGSDFVYSFWRWSILGKKTSEMKPLLTTYKAWYMYLTLDCCLDFCLG